SQQLACDSIIFTGRFTGEYTLIRNSHLAYEPETGRPWFDQHGRCSDPAYYVAGNMTHPADMGDQCYQEGLRVGRQVARTLQQDDAVRFEIPIQLDEVFRLAAPGKHRCLPERRILLKNIDISGLTPNSHLTVIAR
ncbi:MAG: pyridine nucleotide-disulfide oxidoreductase, partial [Serratia liquefaciens]|nr:pyridine nucleotide-disulfide oxidoreductase [Serratia liquefaciens]